MGPEAHSNKVFGGLKLRADYWEGTITLPIFDEQLEIEIDTPGNSPPTADQRECFRDSLAHCDDAFRHRMENALFRYAKRRKSVGLADYEEEIIDELTSPDQIWETLHDPSILIPVQQSAKHQLSITWNSDWDEEHGVQVLYREGGDIQITLVGDDDFDESEPID